jgi:hypothetical protein
MVEDGKEQKREATNTDAPDIRTAECSKTKVTTTECQPQSKRSSDISGNTVQTDGSTAATTAQGPT